MQCNAITKTLCSCVTVPIRVLCPSRRCSALQVQQHGRAHRRRLIVGHARRWCREQNSRDLRVAVEGAAVSRNIRAVPSGLAYIDIRATRHFRHFRHSRHFRQPDGSDVDQAARIHPSHRLGWIQAQARGRAAALKHMHGCTCTHARMQTNTCDGDHRNHVEAADECPWTAIARSCAAWRALS